MTILERLARRGHKGAATVLDAFNPDQPRDSDGKWGEGGGSSSGGGSGGSSGGKGNPAAEGSLAVKEDDRARSLSPAEHRIAQAMSSNRSDTKALQAAGMSREEGIKAAASAREKLGVPPGGSLKEAYKKLSPSSKGGRPMSDRTKDRIDKAISEGKGRSAHQTASEHAASGRRDVAAKHYDEAAKHYETAGNSTAATNMRWKAIEMRQGGSSKRDQPLKQPLKRGAYPGDPGSRIKPRYPGD